LVYDCADYNEGYGESILFPKAFLRRRILGRERNLLSKADIVFAGNQDLKTRGSRYNSNVQMLVNGVGREFLGEVDEIPPEMTDLPHPIIGYVGFLSDYFDFGMIERAARARPHWSFVFVGPWSDSIGKKIEQLECLSNLHFAGKKPYDMIPAYIQSFDVTMIPFLRTEITHDMMPLKLFEYLCRGKPVVSTRILERPEQLEDMVYFTDETDFVKTIEKALNENSPIHVRARVRWATRFTWDYQIERVESVLRSHHVGASTS
jgi:glycosyltransferase involved in cell wall biosynthesis